MVGLAMHADQNESGVHGSAIVKERQHSNQATHISGRISLLMTRALLGEQHRQPILGTDHPQKYHLGDEATLDGKMVLIRGDIVAERLGKRGRTEEP
jgi:hypothetical protein